MAPSKEGKKRARPLNQDGTKKQNTCSVCKNLGHNSRNCPAKLQVPIVAGALIVVGDAKVAKKAKNAKLKKKWNISKRGKLFAVILKQSIESILKKTIQLFALKKTQLCNFGAQLKWTDVGLHRGIDISTTIILTTQLLWVLGSSNVTL